MAESTTGAAGEPSCPKCGERILPTDDVCMACGYDILRHQVALQRDAEEAARREEEARIQAARREEEARVQAARAAQAAYQQAQDQEVYNVDTGLGRCPECGSSNIISEKRELADSGAQAAWACCNVACLLWPLALLAPWLFKRHETWRVCRYCHHSWPM